MGFYVRNSTPNPISVAVGYYDSGCSPITYAKRGWYRIEPGRRALLVAGSAANQFFMSMDMTVLVIGGVVVSTQMFLERLSQDAG